MSTTPTLPDLFRVFGRIGILSFGGPAAQISLMHRELVDRTGWIKEEQFLGALSFCMFLPGPEAMQLATYAGWKLRGVPGGLIGGLLFVLPGALTISLLAYLYIAFGSVSAVEAAFLGIQATVIAIIVQAMFRLSFKVLNGALNLIVAALSFLCLYTGLLPFPAVILLAGVLGALLAQPGASSDTPAAPPQNRPLPTVLTWAGLWAAPIMLVWMLDHQFLLTLALFFSKLAVVTFGGAYAVLAYMVQAVVNDYQWLETAQMMDALGLAETTPGPLILVTQFTGILAGHAQGGLSLAILAGLLTLWCTFTPCFLWIFAAAPYVENLLSQPRLTGALKMISAAVLGVIANLSLWFAMHFLFDEVSQTVIGAVPILDSFAIVPAFLAGVAALLLLALRLPLLATLAAMAVLATGISLT